MNPYHFFYVYVLKSLRIPRELYIGFTHNLRKRLNEHNEGLNISTKRYVPWKLAYYEAFSDETCAKRREINLKNNGNSMRELKKRMGLEVIKSDKGFTLIETLVAISLLLIAIVAPMALTTQSLSSAHYSKDQLIASHLAQEAVEALRHVRDGRVLQIAHGDVVDLFPGEWTGGDPFTIDTLDDSIVDCPSTGCQSLKTNGELYGYQTGATWKPTIFTRSIRANFIPNSGRPKDEVHIEVTVEWQTSGGHPRSVVISENLYRWVKDASA